MGVKRIIEKVAIYRALPFLDTQHTVFYIALSKFAKYL